MKNLSQHGQADPSGESEARPSLDVQLARLEQADDAEVDTSEISESFSSSKSRVRRDANGIIIVPQESTIRNAILLQLKDMRISRYELAKRAKQLCKSLPESAVYEFLRGERQVGAIYLDAILYAAGLTIIPRSKLRPVADVKLRAGNAENVDKAKGVDSKMSRRPQGMPSFVGNWK